MLFADHRLILEVVLTQLCPQLWGMRIQPVIVASDRLVMSARTAAASD